MFDARRTKIVVRSERPFDGLPPYKHEFEQGDMVIAGFHSHIYFNIIDGEDKVGFDIQWIALLSKSGMDGWESVTGV